MSRPRKPRRSAGSRHRGRGGSEWVGGLLSPPFFITDRDEPYRPGLVVWLDVSADLVVGQDLVLPENAGEAVGRTLLAALERPLAGPPRRPGRVRIADAGVAGEVRAALGDATPIEIAPTPELDALLELMSESRLGEAAGPESYFEDGRVPPATVARLFAAADVLWAVAPWRVATDDQLLRLDIPALGVEGACVCIIGNLGQNLGLLIFPSLAGYEAFVGAAEHFDPGSANVDVGSDSLALEFERGAELPAQMRREVSAHGWPVADANAYPRVSRRERDGALRPLVERDVQIAAACATSLSAFFAKHASLFAEESFEPVCESWFDEDDLEVRFTLPYEAFEFFDVEPAPRRAPRARPRAGRNDPCPCGSGKKYKRCHLSADEVEAASQRAEVRPEADEHDFDGRLVRRLNEYATAQFGLEWRRFTKDFVDVEAALQLAVPWSVYQYPVRGRSVVEWFREEFDGRLSRSERRWLSAQQAAWLSVWEVIAVEPGESITLRDLLSFEERCVREESGSRTLVVRDALLGRIVDHEGVSLLCGSHPRPLPPMDAAEVVRRARGKLRRRRGVPPERLREGAIGRYLIKRWEEAVADLELRNATPPQLQNTDGDPLLLTTDHFDIEPGTRAEVETCLAEIEGAEPEEEEPGEPVGYAFLAAGNPIHSSWENTLIGRARLAGDTLRLETNSIARADSLRAQVEAACAHRIRHRVREHADPASPAVTAGVAGAPAEAPPPEAEQLMLDFKRQHYAAWLDESLPVLGGVSPREAVRTARGRDAVDVLLKDMENREQRHQGSGTFDFGELRRELQLD